MICADMKRAGVAAATLALFILTPACAQPEELSSQDARRIQEVAGLYVLPDAFETYLVIELRPDGTYGYELSVGALDERSLGTWSISGNRITFQTEPRPVPPEFERQADDSAPDAPFVSVTWPKGRTIDGIDVIITCKNGETLSGYTIGGMWSPEQSNPCDTPQSLRLVEDIHRVELPEYSISNDTRGLRFILRPNDMGVVDFTGKTAVATGDTLTIELMETATQLRKVPRQQPAD